MDSSSSNRFVSRGLTTAIAIGAVAVATAGVAVRIAHRTTSGTRTPLAFAKGDPDEKRAGDNKRALVGPNDPRWADYSPAVEAYLLRAYPETEVPGEATRAAQSGWAAMNASSHSTRGWQLVRPGEAAHPAPPKPLLFDEPPYVTAGRGHP